MCRGIAVIGTDTGVGKTVVSAAFMKVLVDSGVHTGYYKPVISGVKGIEDPQTAGDVGFVWNATGKIQSLKEMVTYHFPYPVSPHLAAERAGLCIDLQHIAGVYKEMQKRYDMIIVEGCGGLAVPLDRKGCLYSDLLKVLDVPCVIVTRAELGTLNHTFLTVKYAEQCGLTVLGLVVSGFTGEDPQTDNVKMLESLTGKSVLAVLPIIESVDTETQELGKLREAASLSFSATQIYEWLNCESPVEGL